MVIQSSRSRFLGILFLAIFIQTSFAYADEKKWGDAAELSFARTGGNTDVATFAAKNRLSVDISNRWRAVWKAGLLYGKSEGIKNAERYETDLRLDYAPSERFYYYALTGWLQDKFAGIDDRYFAGPGAGYHIIKNPRHRLSAELGANYARENYIDGSHSDFLEGRAFGRYEYRFNEKVFFGQEIEYLSTLRETSKYKVNAVTSLTSVLDDTFAVKISYEIRYDNRPVPEDLNNTDTLLSVALVVNI